MICQQSPSFPLQFLKQRTDTLLFEYFKRHNMQKFEVQFATPSKIPAAPAKHKICKENIKRKRPRVFLKKSLEFAVNVVFERREENQWSWDEKRRPAKGFSMS